jgi:hypothetical protein
MRTAFIWFLATQLAFVLAAPMVARESGPFSFHRRELTVTSKEMER